MSRWATVLSWRWRRWLAAAVGAAVTALAVAVPTAVIPTPIFGRAVAVTWWSYPTVLLSAVLGGLLIATYVRSQPAAAPGPSETLDRPSRLGMLAGLVTLFAVGCPLCNKVVVIALGAAGAMSWFAPVQPFLAVASVLAMAYALHARLGGEVSCPRPAVPTTATT
jgi:hypothetical protein